MNGDAYSARGRLSFYNPFHYEHLSNIIRLLEPGRSRDFFVSLTR